MLSLSENVSPAELLASLPPEHLATFLKRTSDRELEAIEHDWGWWGGATNRRRKHQTWRHDPVRELPGKFRPHLRGRPERRRAVRRRDHLQRDRSHPSTGLARGGRGAGGPLGYERIRTRAHDADRSPSDVSLAYRFLQIGRGIPEKADNGDRRLGSGDNKAIAADLRALRDLGVIAVDFSFGGDTADAVLAEMRRFREDVLAKA
jgi:hypothetical protein